MLSIVLQSSQEQVDAALWPAVRLGLVERTAETYKFAPDRMQEAAYSLLADELRAEFHLLIGRVLLAQTLPEQREELIFEIVRQLNCGVALITQQEEREQLAELNLIAGRRAKVTTAYASALAYLSAGAALLREDPWEHRHELTFALELNRAERAFLTRAREDAQQPSPPLGDHAGDQPEPARVPDP